MSYFKRKTIILGLVESANALSTLTRHGGDDLSAVTLPATMSIQLASSFHSLVLKEQERDFVPSGEVRERRASRRRAGQRPGLESLMVAAAGEMPDWPKINK